MISPFENKNMFGISEQNVKNLFYRSLWRMRLGDNFGIKPEIESVYDINSKLNELPILK